MLLKRFWYPKPLILGNYMHYSLQCKNNKEKLQRRGTTHFKNIEYKEMWIGEIAVPGSPKFYFISIFLLPNIISFMKDGEI